MLSRMIPAHVDEDVERAALRDRRLDRRLDVVALRHVAAHGVTTDRRRRLLRGRLVEVGDDDRRALRARAASPSPRRSPWRRPSPVRSSPRISSCAPTIYGAHVEFRDILAKRRMHRSFLPDPLPPEQIERIVGRHPPRAVRRLQPGRQHRRRHRRGEAARDRRGVRRRALPAQRPQLHLATRRCT